MVLRRMLANVHTSLSKVVTLEQETNMTDASVDNLGQSVS